MKLDPWKCVGNVQFVRSLRQCKVTYLDVDVGADDCLVVGAGEVAEAGVGFRGSCLCGSFSYLAVYTV